MRKNNYHAAKLSCDMCVTQQAMIKRAFKSAIMMEMWPKGCGLTLLRELYVMTLTKLLVPLPPSNLIWYWLKLGGKCQVLLCTGAMFIGYVHCWFKV